MNKDTYLMTEFEGRRVLVTGDTGFKGSWLCKILTSIGAEVLGVSQDISLRGGYVSSDCQHVVCDVRNLESLKAVIEDFRPEIVFHLAAKALVREAYENPHVCFETNVMGTVNMLECLRQSSFEFALVLITSDKVYRNKEWVWGYREYDLIGGDCPYSGSKAASEMVISAYCSSFFKNNSDKDYRIAIARAGNVVGGGDWSENRLVPDCIRSWAENRSVNLRYPNSTRPWQHVLEPLSGYLSLGGNLLKDNRFHCESYNFGPDTKQNFTVAQVVSELAYLMGCADLVCLRSVNQNEASHREAGLLRLSIDKVVTELNWQPKLDLKANLKMTADWYLAYQRSPQEADELALSQIQEYFSW